jgi:hypothetical protein
MKTTTVTLQEIDRLLAEYEKEIHDAYQNGLLAENTVKTYLLHSCNFVKWCHGEFIPGSRNAKE